MLILIDAQVDLKAHQEAFEQYLKGKLSRAHPLEIGHLGASYDVEVHTDGDLWYFTRLAGHPEPTRYWNAFGLLSADQPSNIIAEINFPMEGRNRRLGGILARDSKGNGVWLLHRGTIGGGRPGIGKNAFLAWYRRRALQEFVEVDEGFSIPTQAIRIGQFGDDDLAAGIHRFVRNVRDFKVLVS